MNEHENLNGTSAQPSLWQRFRARPTWQQVAVWVVAAFTALAIIGSFSEEDSAGSQTDASTTTPEIVAASPREGDGAKSATAETVESDAAQRASTEETAAQKAERTAEKKRAARQRAQEKQRERQLIGTQGAIASLDPEAMSKAFRELGSCQANHTTTEAQLICTVAGIEEIKTTAKAEVASVNTALNGPLVPCARNALKGYRQGLNFFAGIKSPTSVSDLVAAAERMNVGRTRIEASSAKFTSCAEQAS